MPFDSPDVPLGDLLKGVATGKIQLPDFQREWKWDTDRIAGLLASISLGYPVGVVMMLQVGGEDVRFAPRPVAGADRHTLVPPEQLILDGQQRLTSLFQSLFSGAAVNTADLRGKRLRRWYYLDMAKALDPEVDREDAILAIPEDRVVRDNFGREVVADYSSREQECAAEVFPLASVFDLAATNEWMLTYLRLDSEQMDARLERWSRFQKNVLSQITGYVVPVIVLTRETPKEAVCTVFEKVNTGGVVLNVFELLTATFAADDFKLIEDWKARKARLEEQPALRSLESTDFLQAVTLLATKARRDAHFSAGGEAAQAPGISARRREVLRLTLDDYRAWAEPVTKALLWTASFLADQRIFQSSDLPYRTQLVPLAAIRVALGSKAETIGSMEKLRRWYWCGVLGELYGGTIETRFARDLAEVVAWVEGSDQLPVTVTDAAFNPARLITLKTRNSAAYKGIYALLMRDGCRDWLKEMAIDLSAFFNFQLDIHHIFPKAWCAANNIDDRRRESIVNKTAISAETNRIIGGRAPSAYLEYLARRAEATASQIDERLTSHAVDPLALRADDFDAFFAARTDALLDLIGRAMQKEVERPASPSTLLKEASDYEVEEDEPDDLPADLDLAS